MEKASDNFGSRMIGAGSLDRRQSYGAATDGTGGACGLVVRHALRAWQPEQKSFGVITKGDWGVFGLAAPVYLIR